MNEEEKVKFLVSMGYRGSSLTAYLERDKVVKPLAAIRADSHWSVPRKKVEREELLALNDLFSSKGEAK